MSNLNIFTRTTLAIIAMTLTGCGEKSPTTQASSEPTTPAWVLTSAPESAQSVSEAKSSAKEGEQIVLRGRIGGRKEPITVGSPVFTMMDLVIPYCGENSDDGCRTPWDYCCETPETIIANSATIQIVDADGQPISESLALLNLKALNEVVIVGTVAPRPSEEILTIRATGVHRVGD